MWGRGGIETPYRVNIEGEGPIIPTEAGTKIFKMKNNEARPIVKKYNYFHVWLEPNFHM